jgi:hypothetical protein
LSPFSEILLDILPTSINPETGKALLDLIRDGTIRGIRARLSIQAMALTVKPTPEVAKHLMVCARFFPLHCLRRDD